MKNHDLKNFKKCHYIKEILFRFYTEEKGEPAWNCVDFKGRYDGHNSEKIKHSLKTSAYLEAISTKFSDIYSQISLPRVTTISIYFY